MTDTNFTPSNVSIDETLKDKSLYKFSKETWTDSGDPPITAARLQRYEESLGNLLPETGNGYISKLTSGLEAEIEARQTDIQNIIDKHITKTNNPHRVTAAHLGLDHVPDSYVPELLEKLKGEIKQDSNSFVTGAQIFSDIKNGTVAHAESAQIANNAQFATRANQATKDGDGNDITDTYFTKTDANGHTNRLTNVETSVETLQDTTMNLTNENKTGRVDQLEDDVKQLRNVQNPENVVQYDETVVIYCGNASKLN